MPHSSVDFKTLVNGREAKTGRATFLTGTGSHRRNYNSREKGPYGGCSVADGPAYNPTVVTQLIARKIEHKRGAQRSLARAVGVSDETVSRWRHGESVPTPDKWPAIEVALDYPPGTFETEAGVGTATRSMGERLLELEAWRRSRLPNETLARHEDRLADLEARVAALEAEESARLDALTARLEDALRDLVDDDAEQGPQAS